jgi:hypothetical protein
MRHQIEFVGSAAATVKSGDKAIGAELRFPVVDFSLRAAALRGPCVFP